MMRRAILVALALSLGACADAIGDARPGPTGAPQGVHREQIHRVPVTADDGTTRLIAMRVCRAPGTAPARLVVINHGSPGNPRAREPMRPGSCDSEAVRWFLARGMTAALPLRRGYGGDGNDWPESYGRCDSPDFVSGGRETARDIAAAIAYGLTIPGVRADAPVVVVGQSAGGWGAMALAAENRPEVGALINFAGGRAGRRGGVPNANCRPDLLVATAGRFGARARAVPMLWIYTANDSFFAPDRARELHAAWRAAGGEARLHQLGPFGEDGHALFGARGGSRIWGPIVEAYLRERARP